jgi:hypothetical protein
MAASPAPTRLKRAARSAAAAAGAASALALVLGDAAPALAQRVVPKIGSICPLGYVDTFNGKCSTLGLMNYTVQPTNGEACPSGWMNVGGGYCRRKN